MKDSEKIISRLKKEAEQMEIPKSIQPEEIEKKLRQKDLGTKNSSGAGKYWRSYGKYLTAAACICLILCCVVGAKELMTLNNRISESASKGQEVSEEILDSDADNSKQPAEPQTTYEEVYASMNQIWQEQASSLEQFRSYEESGMAATSGIQDLQSEAAKLESAASDDAFGTTNVQTEGVDEGDIIKNDGRYLYQMIRQETENGYNEAIQIVDTKDGLKELARLENFQDIAEFYVSDDLLIVIENKFKSGIQMREEDMAVKKEGFTACGDKLGYYFNNFHEISFYSLSNRSNPKLLKTFTLDGSYASSRISDNYFYSFSRFYASPGEGETDYDAYVPNINGARLEQECLYLPENSKGTSYLVLLSVDLNHPDTFVQTMAIVAESDLYYVSDKNIYVTAYNGTEEKEGWSSDKTSLLRFSYDKGEFKLEAKGEIKGNLESSLSLDEYQGNLRAVVTVQEYYRKKLIDDRTGEEIGYEITNDRQTNALYVLDKDLTVIGKIEGLAKDEQIYSARFMGKTGYFVTFRQLDPLFAVDLSDPKNPKILSELKVSGFSDYLHFYGKDRLLGIGMEADEETGSQEGMKLSMFDISNPGDVKEIAKLALDKYNYSEALYNYKAVLIDPEENIFGFEAEGSNRGEYWRRYLVFSYEDEKFVKELELDVKDDSGGYTSVRGTFIGDIFYLLRRDGTIISYDRNTGKQLEKLTQ